MGTGTSQGVPVIGCHCAVCRSTDARDHRLRSSVLVQAGNVNIAIDCGPDFRQQMLRAGVDSLRAILFTHEHNDHVAGIDDVRPFNYMQRADMPLYATAQVAQELRSRFAYAFDANPYPGAPRLLLKEIWAQQPFSVEGIPVTPIEVQHGSLPVLGFRIGRFVYLTDVKTISDAEMKKVEGCHTLIINALHHQPHYSHINLEEALELIARLQPQRTFLTHISHSMGRFEDMDPLLPEGVQLGWDELSFSVPFD